MQRIATYKSTLHNENLGCSIEISASKVFLFYSVHMSRYFVVRWGHSTFCHLIVIFRQYKEKTFLNNVCKNKPFFLTFTQKPVWKIVEFINKHIVEI